MHSSLTGRITVGRIALSLFMISAGILHFTYGETFASIVPDYLPAPLLLVYISGIFEIALGAMLTLEPTRVLAAWGLVALLVAVFPANINMTMHPDLHIVGLPDDSMPSPLVLWLRLPLQFVMIYWAYRYTRQPKPKRDPPA